MYGINQNAMNQMGQRQGWGQPAPRDHKGSALRTESNKASGFADQGQAGFGQLGAEGADLRGQLRDQASGKVSLSAEQLRQGLQQNQAAQMSMAAGARPGSAPMAAMTAMRNAGNLGAGLSGQQAMAGIAERRSAQDLLANFLNNQRAQELQAALGSRGQAMGGYQSIMDDQTRRYGIDKQVEMNAANQPSGAERVLGALTGGAQLAFMGGYKPFA